ncbi:MAG: hypothetical protein ACRDQ5_15025 [Sciscionella sp.]
MLSAPQGGSVAESPGTWSWWGRADRLHPALVFGIDEKTAIRYANSARHLLATAAEYDTTS